MSDRNVVRLSGRMVAPAVTRKLPDGTIHARFVVAIERDDPVLAHAFDGIRIEVADISPELADQLHQVEPMATRVQVVARLDRLLADASVGSRLRVVAEAAGIEVEP